MGGLEAAMDDPTVAPGIPADFDRFIAFSLHRLFAVSDDPAEGDAAVWLIRRGTILAARPSGSCSS